MTSTTQQIETQHADMIHDCALNYFGTLLATCSSDRTIKIFSVPAASSSVPSSGSAGAGAGHSGAGGTGTGQELLDTLRGHEGPVWQVAWAHPKFGNILASCSYDGKVFVWRQAAQGWERIKEHTLHNASVNSVSWAPSELGAMLACASSDGKVSVLTFNDDSTWDAQLFTAHPTGCNAVSWAPATLPGTLTAPSQPTNPGQQPPQAKRFATGGCDSLVRIWSHNPQNQKWEAEHTLEGHTDWVRDVAWQDNIGLYKSYLASASQDKTVIIHVHDAHTNTWSSTTLDPQSTGSPQGSKFADTVWRVSWSVSGAVLAVSCGDGKISLWKENLKGAFEMVSDMDG